MPYPDAYAGRSAAEKRAEIAQGLVARDLAAAVLTLPDSIAWLLNIRGGDIARTPVPLAFAILHADAPGRALHRSRQGRRRRRATISAPRSRSCPRPVRRGASTACAGGSPSIAASAPVWIADRLADGDAEIVRERDPCILPKATKTAAEIAGTRAAHLRDGAAMADFLCWLDLTAPEGGLTEIDVVQASSRRSAPHRARSATSPSRRSAGAGPNGAIVHYRVTEATNRRVAPGDLLLVDSGAQYLDGTTDITRTVAVGPVPPRGGARRFTLVLKGLIAMSRLRWPEGLAGRDIDAVARDGALARPASTTTTAPATASAPTSASTRGRRACRGAGSSRCCRA